MKFSRQEHWGGLSSPSPGDRTWVFSTAGIFVTIWATREAQEMSLRREVRKGLWASFWPFPLLLTRPAGRGSGSCIPAWRVADPEQEYALRTVKGATLWLRKRKLSQARPRPQLHLRLQHQVLRVSVSWWGPNQDLLLHNCEQDCRGRL